MRRWEMKQINIFDLWSRNWKMAYRFFNSKGNICTKAKLKDEWYEDFKKMFFELESAIRENINEVKMVDNVNEGIGNDKEN